MNIKEKRIKKFGLTPRERRKAERMRRKEKAKRRGYCTSNKNKILANRIKYKLCLSEKSKRSLEKKLSKNELERILDELSNTLDEMKNELSRIKYQLFILTTGFNPNG